MKTMTITAPDDWHIHLRDGKMLPFTVKQAAAQFKRAIVMPNLKPPVAAVEQAAAYKERILSIVQENKLDFTPLMTLYLTDNTTADEIKKAKESGIIYGVKLYPAGATTNSDHGLSSIEKAYTTFEEMQKQNIPLLVHGEVTDPDIDIFDREKVFIDRHLNSIVKSFPELRVVLEHVTTKEGVEFVKSRPEGLIGGTLTVQHLMSTRNDMLVGGIRPHYYCLPVLKTAADRTALQSAAVEDNRFFAGTDSAPHEKSVKENACGCAGVYSANAAVELYATIFESLGALDKLEDFLSLRGPKFYQVPENNETIRLTYKQTEIPPELYYTDTEMIVPFQAGKTLPWSIEV